MRINTNRSLFLRTSVSLGCLGLVSCQSVKHTMSEPEPGDVVVCSRCYDEIRKARSAGGPLAGLATNKMVTTHVCEDCKTRASIYRNADDGEVVINCARCAPSGVACDRCQPRDAARQRP